MKSFLGAVMAIVLALGLAAPARASMPQGPEDSLTSPPPKAPGPLQSPPPSSAPAQQMPAPKGVVIGDTALTLPPLDGFHELYGMDKSFDETVNQTITEGNRMLAVYVSDPDLAKMSADPQAGLNKYILVQTKLGDPHIRSAADFEAIRAGLAQELGGADTSAAISDQVARATTYMREHAGKDLQINIGETKFLGKFVDSREALSYLMAANYGVTTPDGKTESHPVVAAVSVLVVKERPLLIFVYSNYQAPADLDFVTAETRKTLDRVFVANGGAPGQAAAGSSAESGQGLSAGTGKSPEPASKSAEDPNPFAWATWAALGVLLAAGLALALPKLLKRPGDQDEKL
jgi:hypothetical protein